jgi:acetyltransferase-like isoleucine patch superfamily enzyme
MDQNKNIRIHKTADVSEHAQIGAGSSIWNYAQIRERACLGINCVIAKDVYVDFEVIIGNNVKIQNGSQIYHGATISDGVFIGPGVILTNDKRPRAVNRDGTQKTSADWVVGRTYIAEGAALGAGSIILAGVKIGAWAMVGAGALVTHDVPDFGLVVGSPARLIGYVCKCGARLAEKKTATGTHVCVDCGDLYTIFQ